MWKSINKDVWFCRNICVRMPDSKKRSLSLVSLIGWRFGMKANGRTIKRKPKRMRSILPNSLGSWGCSVVVDRSEKRKSWIVDLGTFRKCVKSNDLRSRFHDLRFTPYVHNTHSCFGERSDN